MTPAQDPEVQQLLRRRGRRWGSALGVGALLWIAAAASFGWWLHGQRELATHGARVSATVSSLDSYRGDVTAHVRYSYGGRTWRSAVSVVGARAHPVGSSLDLFVQRGNPSVARAVDDEDETTRSFAVSLVAFVAGILPVLWGGLGVLAVRSLRRLVLTCGPWWEGTLEPSGRGAVVTAPDGRTAGVATGSRGPYVWDAAWKSKHVRLSTTPDHSAGLVRLDKTFDPRWLRKVRFLASPHRAMAPAPPPT